MILSVAGRANFDGRPYDGSAAEAAVEICQWLKEPAEVIWCLHDEGPIKPFSVNVKAATDMVEQKTHCQVRTLEHAVREQLFRS